METVFYVYNTNGFIKSEDLEEFCNVFYNRNYIKFKKLEKKDIGLESTIFKKFSGNNVDLIIYEYGYVLKVEGEIRESIWLLKELDGIIAESLIFYVSPFQRIENISQYEFPRGATEKDVAVFLDKIFNNNHYTSAVS